MTGTIIIHLIWCNARQAVSVRPVGLSCVEAVKDWVSSLRKSADPFEIAGFKKIATGELLWATELPEHLGPGIPQDWLQEGAEYEVILADPGRVLPSARSVETLQFHATSPRQHSVTAVDAEVTRTPKGPGAIYPVKHPIHGGIDMTPVGHTVTNVYYLDEFGNRIPDPVTEAPVEAPKTPKQRTPRAKARSRSHSRPRSESPPLPQRRGSTGELWDRLAQPRTTASPPRTPHSRPSYRSVEERQEVVERLLMPRSHYEPVDGEDEWDPNLRTVYRKMTPGDLDSFVQRMYLPHKNKVPRRDIYDEHKQLEREMNTFRDTSVAANRPKMVFTPKPAPEDDPAPEPKVTKLTEVEKAAAHARLYEAARAQREKQRLREEDKLREEQRLREEVVVDAGGSPVCVKWPTTLPPEEFKVMQERLTAKKKPPTTYDDNKEVIGAKPIPPAAQRKLTEKLAKPKAVNSEPPLPSQMNQKKVKVSYERYTQLMENLQRPTERMRLEREKNPVVDAQKKADQDRKKAAEKKSWQVVW